MSASDEDGAVFTHVLDGVVVLAERDVIVVGPTTRTSKETSRKHYT